jgi:hypothetical protein
MESRKRQQNKSLAPSYEEAPITLSFIIHQYSVGPRCKAAKVERAGDALKMRCSKPLLQCYSWDPWCEGRGCGRTAALRTRRSLTSIMPYPALLYARRCGSGPTSAISPFPALYQEKGRCEGPTSHVDLVDDVVK